VSSADRCSARSLAAGEALAGTASTIRRWLLVEHDGPWGADGLLDARLPRAVGPALAAVAARTRARVLLIRRPASARDGTAAVRCFAVDTAEAWLGRRTLGGIEDAATLDPLDRSAFDPEPGPVFAICTHGRRDPCCAERGRPLAEAAADADPASTWECTHVGGDRFAGNLVAFPEGLVFGRVDPRDAAGLVAAYRDGRIAPLDRYRGRTCDPFDVQAAEAALRGQLGLDRIDDARPVDRSRSGERSEVTFATPLGSYRVPVERRDGEPMRLTCHSRRAESPVGWRAGRAAEVEPGATGRSSGRG
jgi:hypothetical protein